MINILFIHGFGGLDNNPPQVVEGLKFLEKHKINCNFKTFSWDSQKYSIAEGGQDFSIAIKKAEKMFSEFELRIKNLEKSENPYYIVGHSLGCYVFLNFLNQTRIKSKKCGGVFFLRAAAPENYSINTPFLQNDQRIINYYSTRSDEVLRKLYLNATGEHTGGETGFTDDIFINYNCSATHGYKKGLFHGDWSMMMSPIIELILFNEDEEVKGKVRSINWKMAVSKGLSWWNNILEFEGYMFQDKKKNYVIQQHLFEKHYRLLSYTATNSYRYREAHSKNLFSLLEKLELKKNSHFWPLKYIK